jgi:cell division protein FtsW
MFLALGVVAAGVAMRTELKDLEKHAFFLMLASRSSCCWRCSFRTLACGSTAHAAGSILVTSFQPVEAVKLILVVYIASYLVRHRESIETRFLGLIKPIGVSGVIVLLLLAQPDFGSATLVIAVTIAMVWLGGARPIFLFLMGLPLMPLLYDRGN